SHTAAWDAKNRHGFEEKLPFTFEAIAPAFGTNGKAQASEPAQTTPPIEKLGELIAGKEDQVTAFLVSREQIKAGQTWRDLSADYVSRALGKPQDAFRTIA